MAKVIVTQVRSSIEKTAAQRRVLQSLGLKGINQSVEHELNPAIAGMIRKVEHIVTVTDKP